MPNQTRAVSSESDGAADDQDHLALRLIELLSDDQVVAKLQKCLFPRELTATIDNLSDRIRSLNAKLDSKDELIKSLETRIVTLESANDSIEQYTRRANLRVCGVPEENDGEDTDQKVLAVFNAKLGMEPPLRLTDLERSHRLGRKADDSDGTTRSRPIIVRFVSERVRDSVYRARTRLKGHDIYLNEDLTARRPARYVRHSQMCPQLDVSDKNDQKTQDMSEKARFVRPKLQKIAGYVRHKIVCVLLAVSLKRKLYQFTYIKHMNARCFYQVTCS